MAKELNEYDLREQDDAKILIDAMMKHVNSMGRNPASLLIYLSDNIQPYNNPPLICFLPVLTNGRNLSILIFGMNILSKQAKRLFLA